MKTLPAWFTRKLREIDPWLRLVWLPRKQRWGLFRVYGGSYFRDDPGLGRMPAHKLLPMGEHDGRLICDLRETGVFIGLVQTYEGGYAGPCHRLLEKIRRMDVWRMDVPRELALQDERTQREEEGLERATQDAQADVINTTWGLRNAKVDLGARSAR